MCRSFKSGVATTQNKLLLSAVVYFAPNIDANTVYPETLPNDVDFLNVVCYDYGIEDTTKTAAHALLRNPADTNKSTSSGITSWIQSVPAKKLVMGLPLNGNCKVHLTIRLELLLLDMVTLKVCSTVVSLA